MSLDHMNGYGYGGFGHPTTQNSYGGYSMPGGYPNYFNNGQFGQFNGQFYNPFGASPMGPGGPSSPGPEQNTRKDGTGFFSRFLNIFNSDPTKQSTNKLLNQLANPNPFMDGSNFYNPYQMAGGDFGKGLHHKK